MEVSYQRNLNHNYMIINNIGLTGREYTVRMIEKNEIPGMLSFQARKINGDTCLYYEITSKQPLARLFETCSMKSRDIEQLLTGIKGALDGARQYLLESRDILLDPEYIYMEIETRQFRFCYVPGLKENGISVLTEFILKKLDHGDRRAVDLGYELYGQAEQDNFSLQETLRRLMNSCRDTSAASESSQQETVQKEVIWIDRTQEAFEKEPKKKIYSGQQRCDDRPESKKLQAKKWRNLMLCGLAAAALAALFGLTVWLLGLDLTQTGGLAFLLLALLWIVYTVVSGKREKRKKRWQDDDIEEDEEAFMDALMSELYEDNETENSFYEKTSQEITDSQNKTIHHEEFCGETRCLTPAEYEMPLRLVSLEPERYPDITISKGQTIIGKRRDQVDICLESDTVSRIHAMLEKKGEDYFITDRNSMNGTFLNGERLRPNERRRILEGDRVSFAAHHYKREKRQMYL